MYGDVCGGVTPLVYVKDELYGSYGTDSLYLYNYSNHKHWPFNDYLGIKQITQFKVKKGDRLDSKI